MPARDSLPERLPQPEVLLGVYNLWVVVALSDSLEEMQALVRARIPKRNKVMTAGAALPFPEQVAQVYWSEAHRTHWFQFRYRPLMPRAIHPARIPARLRERVPRAEPKEAPSLAHVAARPPAKAKSRAPR